MMKEITFDHLIFGLMGLTVLLYEISYVTNFLGDILLVGSIAPILMAVTLIILINKKPTWFKFEEESQ